MPKVLFCASTAEHIEHFHLPYLRFFKEQGFEVHVAVPGNARFENADAVHPVPMAKSLLSPQNLKAVGALRRVIRQSRFDLILTHTALAGAIGRLAVLLSGKRSAGVVHTAHGYLFWTGCSPLRKLIYYTPERLLRGVTDCVITMNGEDAAHAAGLVKKGGAVVQVPGMGVDAKRFAPADEARRLEARRVLSIPDDAFVMVYAAEFSKRKNHAELIEAIAELKRREVPGVLLLCGAGELRERTQTRVGVLGLSDRVRFPGRRDDMERVYHACDLCVSSSVSEGLPFHIIEANLCALPAVASRIRGHTDLILEGETGWCYTPGSPAELADVLQRVIQSPDRGKRQGAAARRSAMRFSLDEAFRANTEAYLSVLTGNKNQG